MEVNIMIYQNIVRYLKSEGKDPVMVAVTCQKVIEKRATQNEIQSMHHLFQKLYQQLRNNKQSAELIMIALNHNDLLEWYLIQSYYHHFL